MGLFWIGQLETTVAKRPLSLIGQLASINLSLYWTTGNNYGRAAAAFFLTTTAAQRSPFYWAIGNFGREAAVFMNWATGINNGSLYWTTN